jgi:hypothetical protein
MTRYLELETIFYCLRLETSLFVASCDSQGHGGGIRPRLPELLSQSQSHIATDGQLVLKHELLALFSLYSLRTDHVQKPSSVVA